MSPKAARVAIATVGDKGLKDRVSGHFGHSKTFTIVDVENGKVKNLKVVQNPAISLSRGIGRTVAQHLASMGVSIVISGKVGPGASIVLNELDIKKIIVRPGQRVIDVLKENAIVRQKEAY